MTVNYFLKRPDAETSTVLFARICYNGNILKYYIPESINPKYWNSRTKQAKQTDKFREHSEFNQRLKDIASDIGSTLLNYKNNKGGEIPNPETFRLLLDQTIKRKEPERKEAKTFLSFFQEIIELSKAGVRVHPKKHTPISSNTIKTYLTTLSHLQDYQTLKKKKIDFDTIDMEFYNDFKKFLMKGEKINKKTNQKEPLILSTNAIGKHIQIIKVVMYEAVESKLTTNISFQNKSFITVREDSESVYLNEGELRELENLDLSKNKRLKTVRDLFLIGCYTGLRYSDYSILKPEQIKDGFIEITQIKTGDPVVIPVHPTVQRIIDQYSGKLPKSITNQKTNEYLKELAQKVQVLKTPVTITFTKGGLKLSETFEKWELITSHTARRSFATNEYEAGTPSITIMAITGHKTEKAFLKYIKLKPKGHAKLLKQHWEERNNLRAV